MLVVAVLTLYTSDPHSAEMQALVAQLRSTGRLVFLKPLDQLHRKKPVPVKIARTLRLTLGLLPKN